MNSYTTQVVSKKSFIIIAFSFITAFYLSSCMPETPKPPPLPNMSQLEIRQMQTRQYPSLDQTRALKAVIAALQDQGFTITMVDNKLGLVTASMDITKVDKATKEWSAWFSYAPTSAIYQTALHFLANATVRNDDKLTVIRISIVEQSKTNTGGVLWSQPLYDQKIYQEIFSKIEKSLFLEKANIHTQ